MKNRSTNSNFSHEGTRTYTKIREEDKNISLKFDCPQIYLYYYRDRPKITMYPMVKLSENLFALDDNYPDIFRIRFVMGKNNQAIKLIGILLGGQRNESVRGADKSK